MSGLIAALFLPVKTVLSWFGKHLYLGRDLPGTFFLLENEYGHRKSREMNASVDRNGEPLPWFTYPAIEYLKQLDLSEKTVFEWGCGNSSLFFARRVKSITSVESDPAWYESVSRKKGMNQGIILEPDAEAYPEAIASCNSRFDIVIIDGRDRQRCARACIPYVSDNGLIILDNAAWYKNTARFLRDQGFLQVDMSGFAPIIKYVSTTSFFFSRSFDFRPTNGTQPVDPPGGLINDNE